MKIFLTLLSIVWLIDGIDHKEFSEEELLGKSTPEFYNKKIELQREAKNAFILMQKEALKSGVKLEIISDYRSFEHQKRIWTRKYNRFLKDGLSPTESITKIVEYSTIPGTSRHHWGTDVDVIDGNVKRPEGDVLDEIHFTGKGVYSKLKNWMDLNASEFGFCLVYTNDINRKGFKYEPWHYTYEPLSKEMLADFLKIDIRSLLKNEGVPGNEYFTDSFINQYIMDHVLDINPDVKKQ